MAIGSRRTVPTLPSAAAVCSLPIVAPMNTPCCQSLACVTSGTVVLRRAPNRIAEIGTPRGSSHSGARGGHGGIGGQTREFLRAAIATPRRSSHSGASVGHCDIGVQYREFGCAAFVSVSRKYQSLPFQSIR